MIFAAISKLVSGRGAAPWPERSGFADPDVSSGIVDSMAWPAVSISPDQEMMMLKLLAHFALRQTASGYIVQVESDDGEILEFLATDDQLEQISSEIGQRGDEPAAADDTSPDEGSE